MQMESSQWILSLVRGFTMIICLRFQNFVGRAIVRWMFIVNCCTSAGLIRRRSGFVNARIRFRLGLVFEVELFTFNLQRNNPMSLDQPKRERVRQQHTLTEPPPGL